MMKKEQGFTLIELMVVVLIIAILVAIAVPVFTSARESAWRRTCQANLRTIDGAVQTYYASYDALPAGFSSAAGVQITDTHPLVAGGFLKRAPTCPKWDSQNGAGTGYYYLVGDTSNPQGISAQCPGVHAGTSGFENHTY